MAAPREASSGANCRPTLLPAVFGELDNAVCEEETAHGQERDAPRAQGDDDVGKQKQGAGEEAA